VVKSGVTTSFTYDALGRRATKTVGGVTTKFLYDGADLLEETDSAGTVTARYLAGPGLDEPLELKRGTTTSSYSTDGLGSITHLTNATGAIAERYTYETFGKLTIKNPGGTTLTTSALGNRFTFTGREWDSETGLYYYRARYYNPNTGRFLSRDPLGYLPDVNLYRYVGNNPVNWIDAFGLDKAPAWKKQGFRSQEEYLLAVEQETLEPVSLPNDPFFILLGFIPARAFMVGEATFATAGRLAANRAAGNAFRDEIANLLRLAGYEVRTEVYKGTPLGRRFIDIEVSKGGQILGGVETKVGGAIYNSGQRAKDAYLRLQGYIVTVVRNR